jgi:hypothetical protein
VQLSYVVFALIIKEITMYVNGNKHPILWWLFYGVPFMIYSSLPKTIKRKLFYKYSNYAKAINKGNYIELDPNH